MKIVDLCERWCHARGLALVLMCWTLSSDNSYISFSEWKSVPLGIPFISTMSISHESMIPTIGWVMLEADWWQLASHPVYLVVYYLFHHGWSLSGVRMWYIDFLSTIISPSVSSQIFLILVFQSFFFQFPDQPAKLLPLATSLYVFLHQFICFFPHIMGD